MTAFLLAALIMIGVYIASIQILLLIPFIWFKCIEKRATTVEGFVNWVEKHMPGYIGLTFIPLLNIPLIIIFAVVNLFGLLISSWYKNIKDVII